MAVRTFFPDANPESTSVDGEVVEATDAVWATIIAAAGDSASPSGASMRIQILVDSGATGWSQIARSIILFDKSSFPSEIITSVTLGVTGTGGADASTDHDSFLAVVTSTPASNTDLASGDYAQLGSTRQASDISFTTITNNGVAETTISLTVNGLATVRDNSIVKFGLRIASELDNIEPLKVANEESKITWHSADEGEAGDERPILSITSYAPFLINQPLTLMPEYDPRDLWGDIANMPYSWLELFSPVHFGPNAIGAISGPTTFDIIEGPNDFEIRTPL